MTLKNRIRWRAFKIKWAILTARCDVNRDIAYTLCKLKAPGIVSWIFTKHYGDLVLKECDYVEWSNKFVEEIGA